MAIIYTYPIKTTLADSDLILISDSADANKTKNATVTSIKDAIDVVDSLTATLPLLSSSATGSPDLSISGISGYGTAGQVMRMNTGATALEWATVSGGSGDGLTIYNDGSGIGLNITKLDFIGSGVLATVDVNDNARVNVTISGGSGVDSVVTTNGTYIDLTPTSASTGAVTVTADLSAADGTSDATTRFLSKNNTWDIPTNNLGSNNQTLTAGRSIDMAGFDLTLTNNSAVRLFDFEHNTNKLTVGNSVQDKKGTVKIEGQSGVNRGGILEMGAGGSTNHVQIKGPDTLATNYDLTLPNAQGATGTFLQNDGTGVLSFVQGVTYQEGTWSPVMFGAGSPSVTATGQYVKIGKNVTVWFSLICTAGDTLVNARISGLPFNGVPSGTYGYNGGASISQNTSTQNITRYVTGVSGGATTLDLRIFTSGTDYQYALGYWPSSSNSFTVRGSYTYKSVN
jgi:hypothetical protein